MPLVCFHVPMFPCFLYRLTAGGRSHPVAVQITLEALQKGQSHCPGPANLLQTSQSHLSTLPAKTQIQLKMPEVNFRLKCGPSVLCWQHKGVGTWNLSLGKTLSRRTPQILFLMFLRKDNSSLQCICQPGLQQGPQWRCQELYML